MEEELLKKLKELESKKCKMLNCPVVINNIKSNEEIIRLKQENREQQKEIEELKKYEQYYKEQNEVNAKFIPESKIKDKIDELENVINEFRYSSFMYTKVEVIKIVIIELKKLLESEE